MKTKDVTMVRIYLTEGEHLMKTLLGRLHDVDKVCGVTVFRGITGFGRSGQVHSSSLLDISLDLPLVIEFFDTPDKVEPVLERLAEILEPGHVVCWPARVFAE